MSATDIEAAVLMIRSGAATSVRLTGFHDAARLAPAAMMAAQRGGVICRVERSHDSAVILAFFAAGRR
jgi:hypothetical protein